ncbi:hypothetical protein LINGRAHAP2_LOCUS12910 [Linum grandiflorum]
MGAVWQLTRSTLGFTQSPGLN